MSDKLPLILVAGGLGAYLLSAMAQRAGPRVISSDSIPTGSGSTADPATAGGRAGGSREGDSNIREPMVGEASGPTVTQISETGTTSTPVATKTVGKGEKRIPFRPDFIGTGSDLVTAEHKVKTTGTGGSLKGDNQVSKRHGFDPSQAVGMSHKYGSTIGNAANRSLNPGRDVFVQNEFLTQRIGEKKDALPKRPFRVTPGVDPVEARGATRWNPTMNIDPPAKRQKTRWTPEMAGNPPPGAYNTPTRAQAVVKSGGNATPWGNPVRAEKKIMTERHVTDTHGGGILRSIAPKKQPRWNPMRKSAPKERETVTVRPADLREDPPMLKKPKVRFNPIGGGF